MDRKTKRPPKHGFFPVRPPEPMQLLASLKDIFPQFGDADLVEEIQEAPDLGLHCVMRNFTDYYGAEHPTFGERQLIWLGSLLSEAVSVDDKLENAVSTCMLEHLEQLGKTSYGMLSPHLSEEAKRKTQP